MAGNPKYDRGEYKRNLNYKVRYGITIDDFNVLLEKQGGTCGFDTCTTTTDLVVDHCHDTNKVRGILCRQHNTALGGMGDTLPHVQAGVRYLERSLDT